ncbi:NB-ARC domain-containing protein, partial [Streptomyces cyaneofuscatus]|uniref:NB-ARC domain-containing protein n=1 Tax=Streptomyces cyaneofuscatus TaxID=66883 RepID=UPI003A9265DA
AGVPAESAVTAASAVPTDSAVPADATVPAVSQGAGDAWQRWLSLHRALIVLDDVPDEAFVRGLLPRSGPSSVVLTARGQLAGLAPVHRIALGALADGEALELLAKLIGPGRLRTDPAAALRIVRACGALPLAVGVGGMRLAVLRHLPLAEYADRLGDPSAALDELVAGDISVRLRMASGWQDLSADDRRALGRLAGPAQEGGFTLDGAMEALGCGERAAIRTVESLIDAGGGGGGGPGGGPPPPPPRPAGRGGAGGGGGGAPRRPPPPPPPPHAALYEVPRLLCLYAREWETG